MVVISHIKRFLFLMPGMMAVMMTGQNKTRRFTLKQIFNKNTGDVHLKKYHAQQIKQQYTLSSPNTGVGNPVTSGVSDSRSHRFPCPGITACIRRTTLLLILCITPLQAISSQRIAVLYPESGKRASQLYATIIKSMQKNNNVEIQAREFSDDDSAEAIQQWLTGEKSQAVILLGQKGMKFGEKLSLNIPVISGAHMQVLPNQSSVSLTADPQQLFRQLKKLQPNIKTVHVIYHEANSGWLIKHAQQAAHKNNITLNAVQVDDMHSSGPVLKQMAQSLNPKRDAIWLPYDPILPVKPLLPDLLKKAWDKSLIIFSGNPYHVQQGTLFALFPDYSKLGPQLIEFTLNKLITGEKNIFEPSRYLNSAINVRTASHLGIQISSIQKEKYKMVFPKK